VFYTRKIGLKLADVALWLTMIAFIAVTATVSIVRLARYRLPNASGTVPGTGYQVRTVCDGKRASLTTSYTGLASTRLTTVVRYLI